MLSGTVTEPVKNNCFLCQLSGDLVFKGFSQTKHHGRCYREVKTRTGLRLTRTLKLLFEFAVEDKRLHIKQWNIEESSDLGLLLFAMDRPILSYKARKLLKKKIRALPAGIIDDFLASGHKERLDLFGNLHEKEISALWSYHQKRRPDRIKFQMPEWNLSDYEPFRHATTRLSLFSYYFLHDLFILKKPWLDFGQKAPSPLSIVGLKKAKKATDLILVHHLKNSVKINRKTYYFGARQIGAGGEHRIQLSLKVHCEKREMVMCATAIPNIEHYVRSLQESEADIREAVKIKEKRDFAVWKKLSQLSPHVIKPYHRLSYWDERGNSCTCHVMEYGERTLIDFLGREFEISDYINLIEGLMHIHEGGHWGIDIKPENIVSVKGRLKYIDVASAQKKGKVSWEETVCTPSHEAPEIIKKEGAPSPAIDVFALGIVFFNMKRHYDPFFVNVFDARKSDEEKLLAYRQFLDLFEPEEGDEIEHLVRDMLREDPKDRITAKEAWQRLQRLKGCVESQDNL